MYIFTSRLFIGVKKRINYSIYRGGFLLSLARDNLGDLPVGATMTNSLPCFSKYFVTPVIKKDFPTPA
jgi:hypothetical protein